MSSEKYRYLSRGVSAPLTCSELKLYLPKFGIRRLVETIWLASQNNDKLYKALMVAIGIELANGDLKKAKHAIDYALDLPDYIKYNENGYGLILDEIKTTLEFLLDSACNKKFVVNIAKYATIKGRKLIENFDDAWDWICSLERLEEWLQKIEPD
jgi:hypothetical protein